MSLADALDTVAQTQPEVWDGALFPPPHRYQAIILLSTEVRMEFHTEREEALYTTLRQVLQNHVTTHRISYHHTLAACIPVLGYILYVMLETWEEAPDLIV